MSGGSIELVDVVSGSRNLLIPGAASFPTVTAEGRLAYLDGEGQVFIQGSGPVPGVVTGSRPAIQGGWALYAGGDGLMVAPVDGGSPPMALGISGADPAWGSASGGFTPPSPPPPVDITGLDPEVPIPGQEALILGSGFDPIIASNTRVFFPTSEGEVEVEVLEITATSIRVVVPRGVAAGGIRVATLTSEATFPYTPIFGSVAVTAVTPWGAPVAGLGVVLTQGGTEASSGVTDASGSLFLDGILAGDYTAAYAAPAGFAITRAPPTALTVTTDVLNVEVEATPEVRRVTISPETPEVEVGSSVEVMLQPLDINGDVIPLIDQVTWAGSSPKLNASGSTLTGTLTGVAPSAAPGDALFRVFVNGTGSDFFATVTSFIEGTFTLGAASPVPGEAEGSPAAAPEPIRIIEVELRQGSTLLMQTESDVDGHYRFPGLFAGSYTVHPLPRADYKGFSPSSASVTLDPNNPTGRADFVILTDVFKAHVGDLVISDSPGVGVMTLAEAAAARYIKIEGSLRVEGTSVTNLDGLETIREVTGNVTITNNLSLTDVAGLNGIEEIGIDLTIANTPGLATINLPVLAIVGDDVKVLDNLNLIQTAFPGLESIGNNIDLERNTNLETASFAVLHTIADDLDVVDNPALRLLSLPSLVTIGDDMEVWENGTGGTPLVLDFSSLERVEDDIDMAESGAADGNDGLESLSFPALTFVGDDLFLRGQPNLTSFTAPMLATIQEDLHISDNPMLTTLGPLGALVTVGETLVIENNDGLTSVSFPKLALLGAGVGVSTTYGLLRIENNPFLTTLDFTLLTTVNRGITISNNDALTSLDALGGITSPLWTVFVSGNASLTSVSGLSGIGTTSATPAVGSGFTIQLNPMLCEEDVDALIATIDLRNPGSAFALAPVNVGNMPCL